MQNILVIKKTAVICLAFSFILVSSLSFAQGASNFTPEWVKRSNEIAYQVLESGARFAPEFAGQSGVEGYDEEVFDLGENLFERQIATSEQNIAMLKELLAKEEDPRVAQDIEIMIKSEYDDIESTRINYERVLPYGNFTGLIFAGFRGLLDKQVPHERQKAALVRLKKYTGQATAYYYGYENMQALRASTELRLKGKFDQREFHDFVLAQGQLPPDVLNKAVDENFIAPRLATDSQVSQLHQVQVTQFLNGGKKN